MKKHVVITVNLNNGKSKEVYEDCVFCPKCGFIDCVCMVKETHLPGCTFRTAMMCPVSIECKHGCDVCPVCDPCNCRDLRELEEYGLRAAARERKQNEN